MIISTKFGAQLATLLPLDIMRKAFGIFVILVGIKIVLGR
jgi:hypothetical protein